MKTTEKELKIGDVVTYTYPGLPLVHGAGTDTGKIVKIGKRSVRVIDTEIHKGETRLYEHIIDKDQII